MKYANMQHQYQCKIEILTIEGLAGGLNCYFNRVAVVIIT